MKAVPITRDPEAEQRLGTPKAITAVAHKLARIVWRLLEQQKPYDPQVWAAAHEKLKKKKITACTKMPPPGLPTHRLMTLYAWFLTRGGIRMALFLPFQDEQPLPGDTFTRIERLRALPGFAREADLQVIAFELVNRQHRFARK